MNSKTNLFSKGLIKADLKRFWIFSLIYGGLIFLIAFFGLYIESGFRLAYEKVSYTDSPLFTLSVFSNFIGVLFGGVLAPALFSFLKSERAVSFYHGLPHSRGKIYISKLLSAAALLILPVLANVAFVMLTKVLGSGIPVAYRHILIWAGIQLIYSFIAFAFMTLISSFTGNTFSLLLIAGACFTAPALLLSFFDEIGSLYLLGYAGNVINTLKYIYITPYTMKLPYMIIYAAAAAVFLLLAFFIYKARPLERSGEALTFKTAKVIFIYAAALLGGIISYWYFSIWFEKSIFYMLPFGIASIIIANMINKKGITLRKAPLYTGVFVLAVLLLYGGFKSDFTGFEKRMPSADRIEGVMIYSDNPYMANPDDYISYRVKGSVAKNENPPDFYLKDKKEIEDVLKYHEFKIDEGKRGKNYTNDHIYIEYKLSGGKKLLRRYRFDRNADKEFFETIAATDTLKRQRYNIYKNSTIEVTEFKIKPVQDLSGMGTVSVYPASKGFTELYDALQKDIENLSYDNDASLGAGGAVSKANIIVTATGSVNYARAGSPDILVTDGFTNTMPIIERYKFNAEGYTPDDIVKVDVNGEEITDKAQILEATEKAKYSYENYASRNSVLFRYRFYFANGDTFDVDTII